MNLPILFAGLLHTIATGVPTRPSVAVTIAPLRDIARRLGNPEIRAVLILPPGASPHTFEPTPRKIQELVGVQVLFCIGHGLDDWAAAMARAAGVPRIVRVDSGVRLRRAPGSVSIDPHYWLSADNGKAIARTVESEMEKILPQAAPVFRSRLARYLTELERTDAEIRRLLADLPNRNIATFHDAFEYFADAYDLNIVAVFEPYPGREPGPKFVREFGEKIRQTRVRVIFAEPQLSIDILRPIARDLGVALSVLDPLGGVPGRETFLELMRFNAGQIARSAAGGN
jgi:ABC-type Zn uptake system ZnuABC Zn-binding protein ZnuA